MCYYVPVDDKLVQLAIASAPEFMAGDTGWFVTPILLPCVLFREEEEARRNGADQ